MKTFNCVINKMHITKFIYKMRIRIKVMKQFENHYHIITIASNAKQYEVYLIYFISEVFHCTEMYVSLYTKCIYTFLT